MPPLIQDRWTKEIRALYAKANDAGSVGNTNLLSTTCDEMLEQLSKMEKHSSNMRLQGELDFQVQWQLGFSLFDAAPYFEKLDRTEEAKSIYLRAADVFDELADSPHQSSVEFKSQVAACHNRIGLIALNSKRLDEAENSLLKAIEIRRKLMEPFLSGIDCGSHEFDCIHQVLNENMVYLAGAYCNLGNVNKHRGLKPEARDYYDRAMKILRGLYDQTDEEIEEHFSMMRYEIYGQPGWYTIAESFLHNCIYNLESLSRPPKRLS